MQLLTNILFLQLKSCSAFLYIISLIHSTAMKPNSLYVGLPQFGKQKYINKIIFTFNCARKIWFSAEMICNFNFIIHLRRCPSLLASTPPLTVIFIVYALRFTTLSRILNAPCPVLSACVKMSISYRFCVL